VSSWLLLQVLLPELQVWLLAMVLKQQHKIGVQLTM
jgi:hypothetical protein